jgi:hypothetical protein
MEPEKHAYLLHHTWGVKALLLLTTFVAAEREYRYDILKYFTKRSPCSQQP